MRIDLKEVTNLLYICNVNHYEIYMDTEIENIVIEVEDSIESVAFDELVEGLEEIFDTVDVVGSVVYCSYYFEMER